ncbi:hypothetical protein ACIG87_02825 [Micromonospora sp. NPDC051925]
MICHRMLAGAAVGLLTAALGLPGVAVAGPRQDSVDHAPCIRCRCRPT